MCRYLVCVKQFPSSSLIIALVILACMSNELEPSITPEQYSWKHPQFHSINSLINPHHKPKSGESEAADGCRGMTAS
uniref:Putative secreted protein n=1 Tax=Anopheles darlingi TaxID=43151 RepID=A0A2M4DLN9_ANODA